jgi:hypothetical protein
MSDEQRTDEPSEDEREGTIGDLEPSEEEAEDVRGGQAPGIYRKVDN